MKRFVAFIIAFILCLLSSCVTKSNPIDLIKVINISKTDDSDNPKYTINFPKIDNIDIDNYVESETLALCDEIITNFSNDIYINVDYQTIKNNYALSFLFNFQIYKDNQINKDIKRTFNFDIKNNQIIILNETILKDIYLDLINQKLGLNLNINIYDVAMLKYLINEDIITFIIPKEITQKDTIEVSIPNHGDEHTSIVKKTVKKIEKAIALTFDDGPSSKTIELIDLLNKYQVKATFFLVGERVLFYPSHVQYIYQNHHEIGNHSYHHLDFTKITTVNIFSEINKTQEVIYNVIKSYPKVFRFPYGKYNHLILNYINFPIIGWDSDSKDWDDISDDEVIDNVIKSVSNNSIIIFHDFNRYRKVAIEEIIKYLITEGYEFITISQMFNLYQEQNIILGKIFY